MSIVKCVAIPIYDDHLIIGDQRIFRDSEDANLYYSCPNKLEVSDGENNLIAPKLTSILSPDEKWNFFEVTLIESLSDAEFIVDLRKITSNSNAYLKKLPISNRSFVIINGLTTRANETKIIGQFIFQPNDETNIKIRFRMDQYAMELLEEIIESNSQAGFFSLELEYEAILIQKVTDVDIDLNFDNHDGLNSYNFPDSIGLANRSVFKSKIEALNDQLIEYDTTRLVVFRQTLVLDDVIYGSKIVREVKVANENEAIPIWSSSHVYCSDFIENTRPELAKKIVNICATGAEGKSVCEKIEFLSDDKGYSQIVSFPIPVNIKEEIRYDVVEIYRRGDFVRKDWVSIAGLTTERIDISSSESEILFEKIDFLIASEAMFETSTPQKLNIEIYSYYQDDTIKISHDYNLDSDEDSILEHIQFYKDKGREVLITANWVLADERNLRQEIIHTNQEYHFLSPVNAKE